MNYTFSLSGLFHARHVLLLMMVLLFLFGIITFSQCAVPSGLDCTKWKDSMIVVGIRYLQNNEPDSARFFFAAAYYCGMSKDSMYYFAAEVYLQSGKPDTALVFNWALQNSKKFDTKICSEQRERIQKAINLYMSSKAAEQIVKRSHFFSIKSFAERNKIKLNKVSFIPYQFVFDPKPDIDDAGGSGGDIPFFVVHSKCSAKTLFSSVNGF